jgi:hypothetical protein
MGWAIGLAIGWAIGQAIFEFRGMVIGYPIAGTIGGWISIIVLRKIVPSIQSKQVFFVIFGWAVSWFIGWIVGYSIGGAIGYPITGAIGGLITIIALRQIVPSIQAKKDFFVIIGWVVGWFIGWVILEVFGWSLAVAITQTILYAGATDSIYDIIIRAIAGGIVGSLSGAIGGGVMYLWLAQAKFNE